MWVVMYVVDHLCYVFTVNAGSTFADAATVQDGIDDVLRRGGVRPDTIQVFGPYIRIVSDGLPVQAEVMAGDPLYDVAKRVTHEAGYSWTDPRTNITHEPPPMLPSGVVVREATQKEQYEAILLAVQQAIHAGTATHDCGEWVNGYRCAACGRWTGHA
jgi:hypothetical protein